MAMSHFLAPRRLDGGRAWGSLDIYPSRYGVSRYRLVVFPPGISRDERRFLRWWRTWPFWGGVLWVLTGIVLSNAMTPGASLAISTSLFLGTGAITFALAGPARAQVRTLYAITMDGYTDDEIEHQFARLRSLAGALAEADRQRAEGTLSALDHEALWWQVYDGMAAEPQRGMLTPHRSHDGGDV
jgi:hypothetical protein